MKTLAAITGVQGYLPEFRLTNAMLEQMVETNDEWIVSRTGIKERRILKGEGQGVSVMAIEAVNGLLEKTKSTAASIDLIVAATITNDMLFPSLANTIGHRCGLTGIPGFDISAACCGFLYAINTASKFIESGTYKKIIVVGADKMSSIINYKDRSTCIIFGDGAAAVMLEANTKGFGLVDCYMGSDGRGEEFLHVKAGGSRTPLTPELIELGHQYIYQDGGPVFKTAVSKMAESAKIVMERNNLNADNLNWLVPHQANKRIIDATAKFAGLTNDKVMINIQKYGNTTAATIPLCLWDWEEQLKPGDNIMLAAFGGGFTWGATYLKWAY